MSDDVRDAGYDEWIEALDDGDGYYLECPDGHGSLPPRVVCPECGAGDLTEEPLPRTGRIETCTETHVATPDFEEDTPYVVAVADFGPLRLTGQVRGVDAADVEIGATVEAAVEQRETTDDPLVVFRPR